MVGEAGSKETQVWSLSAQRDLLFGAQVVVWASLFRSTAACGWEGGSFSPERGERTRDCESLQE